MYEKEVEGCGVQPYVLSTENQGFKKKKKKKKIPVQKERAFGWSNLCGVLEKLGCDKKLGIPVREGISLFVHRS